MTVLSACLLPASFDVSINLFSACVKSTPYFLNLFASKCGLAAVFELFPNLVSGLGVNLTALPKALLEVLIFPAIFIFGGP